MKITVYLTPRGVEELKNFQQVRACYGPCEGYIYKVKIDLTEVSILARDNNELLLKRYSPSERNGEGTSKTVL
jgi:hypothetical protein